MTLGSHPRFPQLSTPPTDRQILRRISGIERANEKVLEGKAVISLPMQEHTDKELGIAFRGAFVISCQCLQLACLMAEPRGEVASCSSLWDKAISSISIVFSVPLFLSPRLRPPTSSPHFPWAERRASGQRGIVLTSSSGGENEKEGNDVIGGLQLH